MSELAFACIWYGIGPWFKNRVHATLIAFGKPCPVADLFGPGGRRLLAKLDLPEPWSGTVQRALQQIEQLEDEIGACAEELKQRGADHRYIKLLTTVPGISWSLRTPSLQRSATSNGSALRRNSVDTPVCALACTSQVPMITGGRLRAMG